MDRPFSGRLYVVLLCTTVLAAGMMPIVVPHSARAQQVTKGGDGGVGVGSDGSIPGQGGAGGTFDNPNGEDGRAASNGGTWGAAGSGGGGGGPGGGQGGQAGQPMAGTDGLTAAAGGAGGNGGGHGYVGNTLPTFGVTGSFGTAGQVGGDEQYAGSGGGGGAGGYGAIVSNGGTAEIFSNEFFSAGSGAAGGAGGDGNGRAGKGGNGGDGGIGVIFSGLNLTISGSITAGTGGTGGEGGGTGSLNGVAGSGGNGGLGGIGLSFFGDALTNRNRITGGNGGNGADGRYGGIGGNGGSAGVGGAGLSFSGVFVGNSGLITGGNGGRGGLGGGSPNEGGDGGNGGDGGFGITATNSTINNAGTITGGRGGAAGVPGSSPSSPGNIGIAAVGGVGISGSNLSIVNSGAISGGLGGDGNTRANAIIFTSGNNRLELQGGYSINGDVAANGNNDTLVLGGNTNPADVFNVSTIGDQFQGFEVFSKTGMSTWTLAGTTTVMTPWTISQGTLSISNDANLGNAAGALIFNGGKLATTADISTNRAIALLVNGEIDVAANTLLELSGSVSGAGNLVKTGGGALRLNGSNAYGNTAVEGGQLIGNASSFSGNILNNGEVVFNQTQNDVYAGQLSGHGAFTKLGSGALLFSGNSSAFVGTTMVADGTLSVNGSLGGSLNVTSGGRLQGTGVVGTTTVATGTTIAPGNSIGTLTVNGNLALQPGSTLEVEIAGSGAADLVDVKGIATIAGSTVSVTAIDPETSYRTGQNYSILHADGGVSGIFANAVSKSAFLNLNVNYTPNDVLLNIAIKGEPTVPTTPVPPVLFTTVTETRNQNGTAGGLDTLAQTGSPLALYNSLLMLSAPEARAAFDNLSGEAYAAAKGALINDSQFIRNAALGRLQQAFGGAPATSINALSYAPSQKPVSGSASAIDTVAPASIAAAQNGYTAWGYAYGAWTRQNSDGNAGDVKSSIGGFVTGIDGVVLDTWRLGLLAGYSHSSFSADDRASSGSSDNYTLGAYAGTEWNLDNGNALAFRSGLAYTWHNIDMDRSIAFPGFADRLNADYDAGTFQVFGEVGYKLPYNKALFEPYANLAYVRLKTDGFAEEGLTAAALSVNSDTTDTSFSTLGLRASTEFTLETIATTARADIGWRHAYGDITPISTASFIGSDAFTVWGLPIAEDAALLEAGLDFRLTEDATLGLSYNGQFASGAKQNGLNAKFSVSF
ncbi:autotransporter domain-containing protein [Ochrobactrum vermis]|uniref:Autotransporter domain-containing protein n=1 Tax=Ochrobactrum vermis TaxID=1827297 RepID=A0ABU8PEI6_9HYPH|nr:autotransporter domain-containing protein [Ochrobactrum vermis]PQZ30960.1 autotransporter outer membrane beta-barrel domain-containing protein [Ochrobactrum vermis]